MIYGSQYRGVRRVNQLNGQNNLAANFPGSVFGARPLTVSSTASLGTILNVSGRGVLNFAALLCSAAGAAAFRITLDGRQIFNWSGSALSASQGICAAGSVIPMSSTVAGFSSAQLPFVASLLIEAQAPSGNVHLNYDIDL